MDTLNESPNNEAPQSADMERREFFKKLIFYTSAGAMISVFARQVRAEEPMLIDMTKTKRKDKTNEGCVNMANGLKYVENLKKALANKTATKKEITAANKKVFKPEDQTCDTCALFALKNGKPTCMIIPNCLVHEKGSCNSWSPKV